MVGGFGILGSLLLKFLHYRQFKYFENGNRLFLLKYP
jgi:hypothetical protein